MKKKTFFSLFLSFLLLLSVSVPTWAEEIQTKTEQSTFTLEVTNNLINLKAEQTSFKKILNDLEKKTEIKVNIFDGVDDKKVTLNVTDLPVYSFHSLLEKMDIENFAVVYDKETKSYEVYVLPFGENLETLLKNKLVIKSSTHTTHTNLKSVDIAVETRGPKLLQEKIKIHPKVDGILWELYEESRKGVEAAKSFSKKRGLKIDEKNKITVFLISEEGKTVAAIDRNSIRAYGGEIIKSGNKVMKARIPINMIENIAKNVKGFSFITLPDTTKQFGGTSEGVQLTGATFYHNEGIIGSNVKIAVLDEEFGYLSFTTLPDNVVKIDCSGSSCESSDFSSETGVHGSQVAQVVYDMAYGAQLYLIKVLDRLDLKQAVEYCVTNNIEIINLSVGYYNVNFYDGKCYNDNPVCSAQYAYNNGILFVSSAGNEAKSHYKDVFKDTDGDGFHNLTEANEVLEIVISEWDILSGNNKIALRLTWDAWPTTDQDYAIYLYDSNMDFLEESSSPQTGSQPPSDYINYTVPTQGTYNIAIKKISATEDHQIVLHSLNHPLNPSIASGSITVPADALEVMAVGAIHYSKWETGPQEDYSSQGPNNDNRKKPDISGPTGVTTFFDTIGGTSGAAPHVAGAAALILSKNPSYSVSELWSALTGSAIDMTPNDGQEQDNIYGYGRLNLPFIKLSDGGADKVTGGYNFHVTYTNPANVPPSYVRLILNPGGTYDMDPVNPGDTDYTDGNNVYQIGASLSPGTYSYHFETSDGLTTDRDPESGEYTLTVAPSADEFSMWANPSTVDVFNPTTIYAQVQTSNGDPVPGVTVNFSTFHPGRFFDNNGSGDTDSITGSDGIATIKFEPSSSGEATINGETDNGLTAYTTLTVNPGATEIIINITPPPRPGELYYVKAKFRDRDTGTDLQNKPVTFELTPSSRGTIQNAEPKTDSTGYARCYIQPLEDGPATLTATYDETGESASQSVYLQVTVPGSFTAFKNVGVSGYDVDWSSTGDLVAFVFYDDLYLVQAVLTNPTIWQSKAMNATDSRGVVFSPQGDKVFFGGKGGSEEHAVLQLNYPNGPLSIVWSHGATGSIAERGCVDWAGNYIAICMTGSFNDAVIYEYASSGSEHSRGETLSDYEPRGVAINPVNPNISVVVDSNGNIYEKSGNSMTVKDSFGYSGRSAAWSPNGQYIAIGGNEGKIMIFDSSWNHVQTLGIGSGRVTGLDFSPDNKWLAATGSGTSVIEVGSWSTFRTGPNGDTIVWDPTSTYLITNLGDVFAPFDTFGPVIENLQPPSGTVTLSSSITVSGDITDPIGVSSATITVNGGSPETLSLDNNGYFEHIVSLNIGFNSIVIDATDGGGNSSSATIDIERATDTIGPSISDIAVNPLQGEIGTQFAITARVTDSYSGVDASSVTCSIQQPDENTIATLQMYDDGTNGDTVAGDNIFTALWNSFATTEAIHYIDFYAADNAGNPSDLENGENIDVYDLPVIVYQDILPQSPTNLDTVTISADITDTSGIASVSAWYSIDGGSSWTPLDTTANGNVYSANVPPQNNSPVNYRFSASDTLGHTRTGDTQSYTITFVPVAGPVTPSNTQYNNFVDSPFDLTTDFTDSESNVTSCEYCVSTDGTCDTEWATADLSGSSPTWTCSKTGITGSNGQTLTLNMRATSSGGTGTGTAVARTVDSAAPTDGTLTATLGDAQVSLNWSGFSDSGSGLNTTDTYKLVYSTSGFPSANCTDGTDLTDVTTQTSYIHTDLENGTTYYYRICAYDNVGNISTGATASATPQDTTPPIPDTVTPSNTEYNNFVDSPFDLTTTFTDNESDVTSCEYCVSIDGTCDTEWATATLSGSSPTWTCSKTGITGSNGQTLTLNMRATSTGGTGTATAITRTVDSAAPTTSDNSSSTWTSTSPVTVTLSPSDGSGSGIASTKYCVDTTNSCTPTNIGTSAGVSCANDSECVQYIRYFSTDNVGNQESTKSSNQIRQDRKAPTDGTLTATPGDGQVSLNWSGFSDNGSGLNTTDTYKLVYSTSGLPSANCTDGTDLTDVTTQTNYIHTGRTNGTTYYYRICAYDNVGNISTGATASATPQASTVTISGYVRDPNSNGISGVTMSGDSCSSTNSSGYYSCVVSYGWSGTITPSKSGYSFNPSSRSYSNVTSNQLNQNFTGIEYSLTCPDGGSIECLERTDGGSDNDNLDSGMPKVDIEYEFRINVKDTSGSAPQYIRLYLTQRSSPVSGDFYTYDMNTTTDCSGNWATGANCTYITKLGPAAVHKFYFEAKMNDGTILRYPESGYITGPEVQLLTGYNLVGLPRDINSANLDGSMAFGTTRTYRWDSNLGYYTKVTTTEPVKAGEGYFAYKEANTLPEHGGYNDVQDSEYTYELKSEWNIISSPYSGNVKLSEIQVKKGNGTPVSWTEAVTNGWLVNAIYYYNGSDWGGTYAFETEPDATLVPWVGYWIYLNMVDDTYYLIIPKPVQ